MTVGIGDVYKVTSGNMVLLVLMRSKESALCVVIWANEDDMTAYRVGDTDRWSTKLIEEHWTRVG
jgi:hypothetical protein